MHHKKKGKNIYKNSYKLFVFFLDSTTNFAPFFKCNTFSERKFNLVGATGKLFLDFRYNFYNNWEKTGKSTETTV